VRIRTRRGSTTLPYWLTFSFPPPYFSLFLYPSFYLPLPYTMLPSSGRIQMSGRILSNHYRKLRLCLGFQALPRAFYRALGKENLCRVMRSAQQYSRHCNLCRGSGRRHAETLGIIKSLPRASARHGLHRRRRSERRHIWAAVHCADGSSVRQSAQMRPVPRATA
jgi:hypothetical protein